MLNKKISNEFAIGCLILFAIIVGGLIWLLFQKQNNEPAQQLPPPIEIPENPEEQEREAVYCTMDAKQCADGSFVGRIPPKCEFAPCPEK